MYVWDVPRYQAFFEEHILTTAMTSCLFWTLIPFCSQFPSSQAYILVITIPAIEDPSRYRNSDYAGWIPVSTGYITSETWFYGLKGILQIQIPGNFWHRSGIRQMGVGRFGNNVHLHQINVQRDLSQARIRLRLTFDTLHEKIACYRHLRVPQWALFWSSSGPATSACPKARFSLFLSAPLLLLLSNFNEGVSQGYTPKKHKERTSGDFGHQVKAWRNLLLDKSSCAIYISSDFIKSCLTLPAWFDRPSQLIGDLHIS